MAEKRGAYSLTSHTPKNLGITLGFGETKGEILRERRRIVQRFHRQRLASYGSIDPEAAQ